MALSDRGLIVDGSHSHITTIIMCFVRELSSGTANEGIKPDPREILETFSKH